MSRCVIAPTVSNGTSVVDLVTAVEGQIVYPRRLVITNESLTVDSTVILLDGTTAVERYIIPAKKTLIFGKDDFQDELRTTAGNKFAYKLAASGSSVYVSGSVEQK